MKGGQSNFRRTESKPLAVIIDENGIAIDEVMSEDEAYDYYLILKSKFVNNKKLKEKSDDCESNSKRLKNKIDLSKLIKK